MSGTYVNVTLPFPKRKLKMSEMPKRLAFFLEYVRAPRNETKVR